MRPVTKISLWGIRLGIVVLAIYWITIFTGTHLPTLADFSPDVNDKIKHFTAFFGLAFLLCYITNSSNYLRRFGMIALVCLAYAAIDELTQNFVPGRVADKLDFAADSIGVSLAIMIYMAGKFAYERGPGQRLA